MKFIKSIPLPMSGLALSLAALGNLLLLPLGQEVRYFCGILSAVVFTLVVLKFVFDFPHAREELKNPAVLSAMPTATMALMLLCTYLLPYLGIFAVCLWYTAVAMHLFLMALHIKRFVIGFELKSVFPGWFVAYVGMVTISVTAPAMGARQLGQVVFIAGFILYFIVFTLIVTRLNKVKNFPEPARPTFAIFTAPMSLCIVGYFSSFQERNEILVYIMLAIAAASYIYVSVMMVSLLQVKFYPTYAAFTFPYVISATAFRLGAVFLAERGVPYVTHVATVTMWVAVAVVAYVLVRYVMFFKWWLKF